jgi:hypothetical protein
MKLKHLLTVIPGSQIISVFITGQIRFDKWEAINVKPHLFQKELNSPVIRIETEKGTLKIYCVTD